MQTLQGKVMNLFTNWAEEAGLDLTVIDSFANEGELLVWRDRAVVGKARFDFQSTGFTVELGSPSYEENSPTVKAWSNRLHTYELALNELESWIADLAE
jgi:hypothetical protein